MGKINNLLGQKFTRLTVLSQAARTSDQNINYIYWNCKCDCGKTLVVKSSYLTNGHAKSCGCLKQENLLYHQQNKTSDKAPEIIVARRLYNGGPKGYYSNDIDFDNFFKLIQLPCFYCDSPPSLKGRARRSILSNTDFLHNTLDRINSSLGHTIDNVVPACFICNMSKLNRSLLDFEEYLYRIVNNNIISIEEYRLLSTTKIVNIHELEKSSLLTNIKEVFNANYKDSNMTLDQFYQLTTSNCYYCGVKPSNKRLKYGKRLSEYAKETGIFIYNGLDRIDNNKNHDYENVVPCCKYCNSAKRDNTIEDFFLWINRLKTKYPANQPIKLNIPQFFI